MLPHPLETLKYKNIIKMRLDLIEVILEIICLKP